MRKRTALCSEVVALAEQGFSVATIIGRTGYPTQQVKNCLVYWRQTLRAKGLDAPLCRCGLASNQLHTCSERPQGTGCGRPTRAPPSDFKLSAAKYSIKKLKRLYRAHNNTIHRWLRESGLTVTDRGFPVSSDPVLEQIEQLAAAGCGIVAIAADTGTSLRRTKNVVRRWRKRLHDQGSAIPPCKCGGAHDHSYFCGEKVCGEGIGRRARRQAPQDFEEMASRLSKTALARHYCTGKLIVSRWLSEFPGLVCVVRSASAKPLRPVYRATSGLNDGTYNLIERCVPTSYAPDVRQDIVSTIYLAVLDGSLAEDQLLRDGRSILYEVLRSHGIMYQVTASLDEELSEDGERYADFLADDAALEAFDQIRFSHEPDGD